MRESEIKQMIKGTNKSWEDFLRFMANQTVSSYPDGETDFYDEDVERFLNDKENFLY
jgi:hypothetical protein